MPDSVASSKAAYEACNAADPLVGDDGTCVHNALKAAQPQDLHVDGTVVDLHAVQT
ncbi:MAG: hypothetical protein SXG53_03080 [Pseudomonadota bacterium]|nr:hypothetical protein [Pseudomonadota bacterium]